MEKPIEALDREFAEETGYVIDTSKVIQTHSEILEIQNEQGTKKHRIYYFYIKSDYVKMNGPRRPSPDLLKGLSYRSAKEVDQLVVKGGKVAQTVANQLGPSGWKLPYYPWAPEQQSEQPAGCRQETTRRIGAIG